MKVPGKMQSSLRQRNPALRRTGMKTSQEHEEGMFRAARNKTTTRISNSKLSQSPSSSTSHSTEKQWEQDLCSASLPSLPHSPVSAPSSLWHPPIAQPCSTSHHAGLARGQGLPRLAGCSGGARCRPLPKKVSKGRAWLSLPPRCQQ